ncbi:MAG: HD domain-containing protein [Candidatus Micrarchaeia archaeon]
MAKSKSTDGERRAASLIFESLSLKAIPRTGWTLRRVENPESIAAHSFGVSLCALVLSRMEGLSENDERRLLSLAILHDLHEARIGDVVPSQKHTLKAGAAARAQKGMLSGTPLASDASPRASKRLQMLLLDADKLDMLFQAVEYSNTGNKGLEEFFASAASQIKSPSGKKLMGMALERLEKH